MEEVAIETGPGPGARDGKARVRLPIGSTDEQRSPLAHAQWRPGEVTAKPRELGVPAGASGDRAGTSVSCRLPAPPREGSGEAEPLVQL